MVKFRNPWKKGGAQWNNSLLQSKAVDSNSSSGISSTSSTSDLERKFELNIMTPLGEDACLDTLVQVIINRLEGIRIDNENNDYEISRMDQIFAEVSTLPGSTVDSEFGDCCGTIYAPGVYGLKSESKVTDFIDEDSPDSFKNSVVLETSILGNEKFGDNGFAIQSIVTEIIKTTRPDRFIRVSIGVYRNDICAV